MPYLLALREYLPELARVQAAKEATLAAKKAESMDRMMKDLAIDRARNPAAFEDRWEDDDDEDIDAEDNDIIDRSLLQPQLFNCNI